MLKKQELTALYVPDAGPAVFELGFDRPFSLDDELAAELGGLKPAACVRFSYEQEITGNRVDIHKFTEQLESDLRTEEEDRRLNRPVTVVFHQKLNEHLVSVRRKEGILTYKLHIQGMDAASVKRIEDRKDIQVLLQDDRVAFPYCPLEINDKIRVRLTQKALHPDGTQYGFFIKYMNLSGLLHGRCCCQDIAVQLANMQPLDVYVWNIKPNGKISVGAYPKETYAPDDEPAAPGETIEAQVIAHFFWAVLTLHRGRYYILSTDGLPGVSSYAGLCERYPIGATIRVTVEGEPHSGVSYPVQFRNTVRVVLAEMQRQPEPVKVSGLEPAPAASGFLQENPAGAGPVRPVKPVRKVAAAGADRPATGAVQKEADENRMENGTVRMQSGGSGPASGTYRDVTGTNRADTGRKQTEGRNGMETDPDTREPGSDRPEFTQNSKETLVAGTQSGRSNAETGPGQATTGEKPGTDRTENGSNSVEAGENPVEAGADLTAAVRLAGGVPFVSPPSAIPSAPEPVVCERTLVREGFVTEIGEDGLTVSSGSRVVVIPYREISWNALPGVAGFFHRGDNVRFVSCFFEKGKSQGSVRRLHADPFPELKPGGTLVFEVKEVRDDGLLAVAGGLMLFLPREACLWQADSCLADEYRPGECYSGRLVAVDPERRLLEVAPKAFLPDPGTAGLTELPFVDAEIVDVQADRFLLKYDRFYIRLPRADYDWNEQVGASVTPELHRTVRVRITDYAAATGVLTATARLGDDPFGAAGEPASEKQVVQATVEGDFSGGLLALYNGIRFFLPADEVSWLVLDEATRYREGETIPVRIVRYSREERWLEATGKIQPVNPIHSMLLGKKLVVTVKRIDPHGLLVTWDEGLRAYMYMESFSWERNDRWGHDYKTGASFPARLVGFKTNQKKVNQVKLSVKVLKEPDRELPFRSDETYTARVLCDTPHRLYVDVDGFYGIVNHQEVDWIGRYKCGSKYQPGDTFPCRLLEADLQKGSLKFSRRLTLPSPIGNYRIGQTVSGVVYAVYAPAKKLGLIVDNCIYAYLDKRHVYWEREITLDECPALGSLVTAVVCAISSQTATLFLSLLGDPPYAAGEQIKGAKVDKIDGKGNIHLKSPEGVSLFIAATDKESMNRLPMKYLGKRYITKGENLDVTVESVDTERACFVVSLR